MTNQEIMEIFEHTNAILSGHFKLTSGRHSSTYMQCAKLFTDAESAGVICTELAKKLADDKADIIVSPAVGGILMGYEVSRILGVPNIFAERENGKMTFRRGFSLDKGAKVIVCEDVVTTGGSVKEVIELCKECGAEVVTVASIVDRSGGKADFGTKFTSLLEVNIETFEPDNCPLCKDNVPLIMPGSRAISK